MKLERELELEFTDMRLIVQALEHARREFHGFSLEHIKHLHRKLRDVAEDYTSDKQVKLMVFKEPLLR